jgi:hypothetical protein
MARGFYAMGYGAKHDDSCYFGLVGRPLQQQVNDQRSNTGATQRQPGYLVGWCMNKQTTNLGILGYRAKNFAKIFRFPVTSNL